MRAVLAVVLVVVGLGCGEIANKPKPDAQIVDMAQGMVDAAVDAPPDTPAPAIVSAVYASGISNFALPNTTFTKVPYNAEVYDDESEFDPTTHRFTAKTAGDYFVCASLTSGGLQFEIDIYKNSVREKALGVGITVARGCRVIPLVANDYIEIWAYHATGATVNIPNVAVWDWFSIMRIQGSAEAVTSTAFNAANLTFTRVPYNVESYDINNRYDNANQRFTAAQATDALVCSSIVLGGATNRAEIDLYKNGVRENGIGHGLAAIGGCRTMRLAANDYVETWLHHGMGGTLSIPHDGNWNWTTIHAQPASVSLDSITAFNLPSGVFTTVPYTAEEYDTNGEFNVTNGTFTAATPGDYLFCGALDTRNVNVNHEIDLFKNGNRMLAFAYGAGGATTGCAMIRLVANDQVQVQAFQASGSTIALSSDGYWFWLQVSKIRKSSRCPVVTA